jgi:hypothetical protein
MNFSQPSNSNNKSGFLDIINTNKFFIGLMMILLNIGSKYITIQTSRSMEEYMKLTISKQILIFSMCFLGTRCIITSILLTAGFTILSEYIFNEESDYCIMPHSCRILHTLPDTSDIITEDEYKKANDIIEKYKKNKETQEKKMQYLNYFNSFNN